MVPADDDATPINDPDHDSISHFSKTTHENTGWFGVPTRGDSALQKESKKSLTRETDGRQREREDRDGSVISVGESMSRKSRRKSTRSHSRQTHREFYSDERDLREYFERRLQQAFQGENSVQRKLYSTELNMEMHYLIHNVSLNFKKQQLMMANQWADQAQRERMHLCSDLEMKNRLHQKCYARSCQEMEELKRRCYQEENAAKQRKLEEFTAHHVQNLVL